jgi:hypothetical protein
MLSKEIIIEHYDMEDDKFMQAQLSDTRRPRLTLRHLNKLRKLRDLRKVQDQDRSDFVKKMYGAVSGGEDAGF